MFCECPKCSNKLNTITDAITHFKNKNCPQSRRRAKMICSLCNYTTSRKNEFRNHLILENSSSTSSHEEIEEKSEENTPEKSEEFTPEIYKQNTPEICKQNTPEICEEFTPEICKQNTPEICEDKSLNFTLNQREVNGEIHNYAISNTFYVPISLEKNETKFEKFADHFVVNNSTALLACKLICQNKKEISMIICINLPNGEEYFCEEIICGN